MTIGFQTAKYDAYRLLDAATATNSPPSGAAAGLDVSAIGGTFNRIPVAELQVYSTAGSASMTCTLKLWGYDTVSTKWFPIGVGTGAAKGLLNGGAAIDEGPVADVISHSEPLYDLGCFSRIYLEITAIGGTGTSITANICIPREVA